MNRRDATPLFFKGFFYLYALAAAVTTAGPTGLSHAAELSFLKVAGEHIVDATGQKVYLRGFQGLGFYPIPNDPYLKAIWERGEDPYRFDAYAADLAQYTITDDDTAEMKSTGANVVRLWYNLHEIQKRPGEYSEQALQLLEDTIHKFSRNGIYVILVLGDTGQNEYGSNDIYRSHGLSLWDKSDGLWDQTVALWGVLAQRFSNNPGIAGYDIINEPQPPDKQTLHAYYQDAIRAIRAHDKRHILFLAVAEKHEYAWQLGGAYDDPNIAATFHYYYPHDFTLEPEKPDLSYPGYYPFCPPKAGRTKHCPPQYWTAETLRSIFDTALNLEELRGKPIFVGEFGAHAVRDTHGGLQWIQDVLAIMNQRGLHYTYHNYKHRHFQGYWIMQPEAKRKIAKVFAQLADGTLDYASLTPQQKRLLTTQVGYYRRPGIKEILTAAFRGTLQPGQPPRRQGIKKLLQRFMER
jgi:hypothetical protein